MSHPRLHLKSLTSVFFLLCSALFLYPERTAQWKVLNEFSIVVNSQNYCVELATLLCMYMVQSISQSLITVSLCLSFINAPQKKLPLTSLSLAMMENGNQLGEESLIGWVYDWLTGRITNYSSWATVANGADSSVRVWNMRAFIQGKQRAQFGFLWTGLNEVPFGETQIVRCALKALTAISWVSTYTQQSCGLSGSNEEEKVWHSVC